MYFQLLIYTSHISSAQWPHLVSGQCFGRADKDTSTTAENSIKEHCSRAFVLNVCFQCHPHHLGAS